MRNINIFRYSKLLFAVTIAINLFLFFYIPQLRNVEDVDHFVIKDDPDNLFYGKFKKIFGNDEFFIISITSDNVFTNKFLMVCLEITKALEKTEEIKDVKSLANVDETRGYDDYFEVRKFIQEIPLSSEHLKELKNRALSNKLFLKNLISEDGRTAAIVVELFEKPDDDRYRHRIMEKTYDILSGFIDPDFEFHLAGKTVTDTTMSDLMEKDVSFFIPLSYLLISFCIFYFYRSIKLTLLGVLNISCSLGSTMGFMGFMGITQNSITSIVMPLIMALSLCDTVHLYGSMTKSVLERSNFDRIKAMTTVLKMVIFPCFLTSLTTAIGFLSLFVNRIQPIKEFAIAAVAGIIFEFLFTFFLLAPLITFMDSKNLYKDYHALNFIGYLLELIPELVIKFKFGIIGIWITLFAVSVFFFSQIQMETNVMKFFKPGSTILKSMAHIESTLAGIESFDISLKTNIIEGFKDPENLKVIEDIEKYLSTINGIEKTISFNDFIKDMNKAFHSENDEYYKIPESRNLISQYLLLYDSDEINDFINASYDHTRISVRISEHNSSRQKQMLDQITGYIDSVKSKIIDIKITGRVLQDVNVIEDLFWGQLKSLGIAGITIWGILFLVFRSFSIGFLSIIPNILPIIINFGIMGALGIPLNTATALISAIAIGIAVDDTIHFIVEYQALRQSHKTTNDLIRSVIKIKGRAIISSSLVLCIGFGVLSFSSFVPTVHFGFLCAIIMFSALVADLTILPALLLYFEKTNIVPARK